MFSLLMLFAVLVLFLVAYQGVWTNYFGYNAKMYYNSGNYASPTWVEIANLKNVTFNSTMGEWDSSSRGSGAKTTETVLLSTGVEADILYQPSATSYNTLATAYFARTVKEYAVMDGATGANTARGYRLSMSIFDWTRNEQLEEGLSHKVGWKCSKSDNAPAEATL